MRKLSTALVGSVILGGLAFFGMYLWERHRIDAHHAHLTAFDWFCDEFSVTPAQRTKIEELHTEYFPQCEDHCVHYADTLQTLAVITNDPELDNSPEHEEAARQLAELEREADKQFIDFVYHIAGHLAPEQSDRYLKRMKGWLDQAGGTRD